MIRGVRAGGRTICVDGGEIAAADSTADVVIDAGDGEVRPGLINAHDHLHRNHYPRLGTPPYTDAYAWGRDLHAAHAGAIAAARELSLRDALLFGAFKNVISGVTTVVHHDRRDPFLDDASFPLRVPRLRAVHSLQFHDGPWPVGDGPLCIHLAEGVTTEMSDEVRVLSARGVIDGNLIAVHVVGADPDGAARLRSGGAAAVWCPTSNGFLFGRTAPRTLFACGIDVLLGSDSLLTGTGTLLDELRVARQLGLLDDERLTDAVGSTAARRLHLPLPALEPGAPADLVVLRRSLLVATAADVALVMVGGRILLTDEGTGAAPDGEWAVIEIGGVAKRVRADLVHAARQAFALTPECSRLLAQ